MFPATVFHGIFVVSLTCTVGIKRSSKNNFFPAFFDQKAFPFSKKAFPFAVKALPFAAKTFPFAVSCKAFI